MSPPRSTKQLPSCSNPRAWSWGWGWGSDLRCSVCRALNPSTRGRPAEGGVTHLSSTSEDELATDEQVEELLLRDEADDRELARAVALLEDGLRTPTS
ncbi:hypothetical protein DMENIID0001_067180 [Sergentomyia squamirostris]